MDIMELGAIGELVGGVAVLVTLVYLATQVRQSNYIARQQASQTAVDYNFQLAGQVAIDRELAEVWTKGGDRFEELDDVDQQRLVLYEWRGFESLHHAFQQHRAGLMPDYQWTKLQWVYANEIGERQAVARSWTTFRDSFEEEFRALVDDLLPAHPR